MHELGIVFHVIEKVEKIAKENNVKKVTRVDLEIGEVSLVIPSYFQDVWKWAIKKTEYMKECECNLIVLEAISYCEDCKETFKTTTNAKVCPKCGKSNTYLVTGDEINLKDIEVVENDENTASEEEK